MRAVTAVAAQAVTCPTVIRDAGCMMSVVIRRARQEAACMALCQIKLQLHRYLRSPTPGHARPNSCQHSQAPHPLVTRAQAAANAPKP
ncbi:hypothetical protein FOA52_012010 [Chlamydomonas sp. UWO 241]|nr:hypothetical protein FOA52_012010 [Chlamydomonas sp. UWO 241]